MAKIEIKNIAKKFEEKEVLKDISLDIKDREFCVLVGPSGCGKSTLLRIISGLEVQDSGDLYFDEKLMNKIEPKDRDIAFVFQSYALYPHLTVYENIAFSLKVKKYKKDEIDKKVREASKILGLDELLNRKPKELSGGQRQRVALGRAIVREPKVFLMDEPLSNLDAKLRVQMRSEIKKLQKKLQVTCVYVTHDQIEALSMGDRVVVLNEGKIQQMDTPQNVYEKPNNVFTATFMGNLGMNILETKTQGSEILIEGTRIEKDFDATTLGISENEFLLGFRADDVDYSKPTENSIKLDVTVDFAESLGSYKIAYFEINSKKCSAKVPINVEIGQTTSFYVPKSKLHFFNPETKLRIG